MPILLRTSFAALLLCALLAPATARAQGGSGVIRGRVTDSGGGVLPGAIVTLAPNGGNAVTDKQGAFSIAGLPPGSYTVQVNYVGLSAFTKAVDVAAGAVAQVDAMLSVAGHSEEILVSAERPRGEGSGAVGKIYKVGERFGTLEFGGKIRNGHKDNATNSPKYTVAKGVTIPAAQFAGIFTDANYYDGHYPWPSQIAAYTPIQSYVAAHPDQFVFTGGPGPNKNSFDLTERVTAGYVMNTLDLASHVRLVGGVRVESTHIDTLSFQASTSKQDFKGGGDYTDALPSVALKFATSDSANIRLVYSRALSRPDPSDITQAVGIPNTTQNPPTVSLGNPDLKPEHANNYDIVFEQYFKPLGMLQAGYFYKSLSDPIIATQSRPTTGEWAGYLVSQPGNAGSATLQGIEIAYQQHLTFLPGALAGLGLSANYSYATSKAHGIPLRTDSPALLRQAPHTWNFSPTYDRGPLSVRLGVSYNGVNIFDYQYSNLNSDGTPVAAGDLTAGGTAGPGGDSYLYSHLQIDAQAALRVAHGMTVVVSGLNLNNEVFGFYNGSPQYVVQREFYKPTYAIGLRFNPSLK